MPPSITYWNRLEPRPRANSIAQTLAALSGFFVGSANLDDTLQQVVGYAEQAIKVADMTGITMLVYPPGYDTLPVRIFTLMANGAPSLIAAACVLMIAATVLPLIGVALLIRTQRT